ncbi:hypothetical protein JOQ06_004370 [Pogonophryne albipinna]|uniref:Uncharacterized protein n=1 Tax=Pogonophryne albipinna TaxID=1090488 RepID=A0AAD6ANC7_9TELE|nr:hypothetical protein JOQ06_004370 [Pogonophryne albipinna]
MVLQNGLEVNSLHAEGRGSSCRAGVRRAQALAYDDIVVGPERVTDQIYHLTLPSHAHPPPHTLSSHCPSPSSHLFWATDPAPPHPLCTATLCSRPSPAARLLIGIGGGERIAVRHGRPLEPTKPGQGHSHHSRVTAAHSKQ